MERLRIIWQAARRPSSLTRAAAHLVILFALVAVPAAVWAVEQIKTDVPFKFNNGYASYPEHWHDSPEAAFEYAKQFLETCSGGACKTLLNFRPRPVTDPWANWRFNGVAYHHIADMQFCPTSGGSCWVNEGSLVIQTGMFCPQQPIWMFAQLINTDPIFREYICIGSLPDVEPDKDCNAIAHPIHPATCQKLLIETDYSSEASALEFKRTYRSDKGGSFTSITDAFWLDSRTDTMRCLEGRYTALAAV